MKIRIFENINSIRRSVLFGTKVSEINISSDNNILQPDTFLYKNESDNTFNPVPDLYKDINRDNRKSGKTA